MTTGHNDQVRRLKWACRRGMLELDVLLEPFVEHEHAALSAIEQEDFVRLLACDDPELFAWFMGHEICQDPRLAALIGRILASNLERHAS
ncbi:succinate dehydrogenase assembly factor 2 [Ferrimonas pelagia]|uniref:FAD assembly factor SdhE n=1 Tax=Ferrimonas pelagia TaxID=1177826 RepID=A0ABP9FBR0_9GAMM